MAYTITSQCIRCVSSISHSGQTRCQVACPTQAIQTDGDHYWIDQTLCNHCVGHYSVPQCWAVCPTNSGCIPYISGVAMAAVTLSGTPISGLTAAGLSHLPSTDGELSNTASGEYWEKWFANYNRLVSRLRGTTQSSYWQRWFDVYAQELSKQFQVHRVEAGLADS